MFDFIITLSLSVNIHNRCDDMMGNLSNDMTIFILTSQKNDVMAKFDDVSCHVSINDG